MKLLAVLVLVATSTFAQDPLAITAAKAACGPADARFEAKREKTPHAVAQPEAGKMLVYVIQDLGSVRCLGECITNRIGLDGVWVGATENNSYVYFSVDAGEHHLCANPQSDMKSVSRMAALAHFTAEPGKIYYFRVRTSGNLGQLLLDPLDSDEGRLLIASYPLSVGSSRK